MVTNFTLSKSIPLMEISLGWQVSDLRMVVEGYHTEILSNYRIKRNKPTTTILPASAIRLTSEISGLSTEFDRLEEIPVK